MLFTASSNNNYYGNATVEAAPLDTGEAKVLVENAYFGRYLPGGYLAYVSQGTVFVAPFDARSLKLTGTAIPVLQGVDADLSNAAVQFAVSDNGTAVYTSGGAASQSMNLVLLDRKGGSTVLIKDAGDISSPRIPFDGKKIAFEKGAGGIWVHDLDRATTSAVVSTLGVNFPIWTPDGERLAYSYVPAGAGKAQTQRIFWKRSDGTGDEQPLIPESSPNSYPSAWTPDGKTLVYMQSSGKNSACCDIWTLAVGADGKPQEPHLFLAIGPDGNYGVRQPVISPDGHWLSYVSGESGLPQVYVVPFPVKGGKWQISPNGGVEPRWSKNGHELFYSKMGTLMAVPYTTDKNSFQAGTPREIVARVEMRAPYTSYDVTPDGQHFVAFQFPGGLPGVSPEPTVVLNWLDEVRRVVSSGQSGNAR